jgi:hypothetical protein
MKKKIDMSSQPQPTRGGPPIPTSPLVEVRDSEVHGRGVFAVAPIKKGTRIFEYLGDRISHAASDARYEDHDENDNHTFLFIVDKDTVIDAGVRGSDARFINHQCEGNCESVIVHRRVFIDAVRDIAPGQELGYDYEIGRDKDDPPNVDEIYACRCGSEKCRGTMLWPAKRPAVRAKRAKARVTAKSRVKSRPRVGAKSKVGAKYKVGAKPRTKAKPKTKVKAKPKTKVKAKPKAKAAPARKSRRAPARRRRDARQRRRA